MQKNQESSNQQEHFNVNEIQPSDGVQEQQPGMSKSQLKKLKRKQKWEEAKKFKKIHKKQLKQQKKALTTQQQSLNQPSIYKGPPKQIVSQKKRKEDYLQKLKVGVKVIIDLNFWDLMVEKQKNSLCKQLTHCHSTNRKYQKCINLQITSTKQNIRQILVTKYNAQNWGITLEPNHFIKKYDHQKLVYLTGDAEQQIEQFDQKSIFYQFSFIYIIGGIVDHNRLKKITFNYSEQNKIRIARFPINKYLTLKGNAHLAVNHVFQIILRVYNGEGWAKTLAETIPIRKVKQQQQVIEETQL